MESPLICTSCGNHCLEPPSPQRDYACPRCGRLLPRLQGPRPLSVIARTKIGLRANAWYLFMLLVMFGAWAMAVRTGLLENRAAASVVEGVPRRATLVRLTPNEQRSYGFRLRQLAADLKRDSTDYDVLRRLGQLHLRMAGARTEGRGFHLRRARYYLRRAGDVAISNREQQFVRALLEAANSPNPTVEPFGPPGGDTGAPPRVEEELVRMRLGWLEEQVGFHPKRSRLLVRLGDNYGRLYSILRLGEPPRPSRWPGASTVSDASEARYLAEQAYRRAIDCATTHESRCMALYGQARLYRNLNDRPRAAAALRQLLALQPNNWFAAFELANLCRQLNQPAEAARFQSLSERWRTPDWI